MKLHEFTDRLYAMGGIEQEEKRSRRLNEGYGFLTEARNPENAEVNAIIRKHLGKKSKISKKEQEVLDRYGISRDEYGEFTGPNGKKLMAHGRKSFGGPEAPVVKGRRRGSNSFDWSADSTRYDGSEESFDAVDYANYLTKKQPGSGRNPRENDLFYNREKANQRLFSGEYEETPEESKALRPYSDRYRTLKGNVEDAEDRLENSQSSGWRKPMTDEEIEEQVEKLRQKLKDEQKRYSEWASEDQRAYDDAQKELDDFRKSVSRRRNESLNESAYDMRDGDLRDEFYSLIDGMDPAEVVGMMYWYLDDYALEDMIKDIKGRVSYTNETEE